MAGFFKASTLYRKAPLAMVPRCGACGLHETCKSPKMRPTGEGRRKILIVGEAPGKTEDEENRQFCGKTGERLERKLIKLGVDMRRDCWLTNTLICRPPNNEIPNSAVIDHCRPNLLNTINDLQPEIILLLGTPACTSLLGYLWKEEVGGVSRWAGFRIPSQRLNAWVCPAFHPSYVERGAEKDGSNVTNVIWERHLAAALELSGRPYETIPDYGSTVRTIRDDRDAAAAIHGFIGTNPVAFDYENNCLKPDDDHSEIICCSLSDGERTIAFPWYGAAIEAMGKFIRSDTPKVASNLKHEERWTRRLFGHSVNNWLICSMNAAHWMDCRPAITSIKFQAFVWLGVESYDDAIKPHMRSAPGKKTNNLSNEVEIEQLLRYCGLDSLFEILVAKKQIEASGVFPRC